MRRRSRVGHGASAALLAILVLLSGSLASLKHSHSPAHLSGASEVVEAAAPVAVATSGSCVACVLAQTPASMTEPARQGPLACLALRIEDRAPLRAPIQRCRQTQPRAPPHSA
jgi:hypothetical protein